MAYNLPKLDGIEVTKALRKNGNKNPIVAYIDSSDKNIIKRWIPLGISSYIIKPSKKSIIIKNITDALKEPFDIIHHPKSLDKESLLRQINYPQTAEHIKKHDELRDKLLLLEKKLEHYTIDLHHRISFFLYNWLASHILKTDMDYKTYALSIEEPSFNQDKI